MSESDVMQYLRPFARGHSSIELYVQLSDRTWKYSYSWIYEDLALKHAPGVVGDASHWCIVDRSKGEVIYTHTPSFTAPSFTSPELCIVNHGDEDEDEDEYPVVSPFLSGKFSEEPEKNRVKDIGAETVAVCWAAPGTTVEDAGVGVKYDSKKPDFTLLPWDALAEVEKVLAFGAKKYARDNWRLIDASRYEAAGLRHRVARLLGEDRDPESGFSHLAHEACCLLFQLALHAQGDE